MFWRLGLAFDRLEVFVFDRFLFVGCMMVYFACKQVCVDGRLVSFVDFCRFALVSGRQSY